MNVVKKPYIESGKLYLGGKKQKGGFISPLATVARSFIFPLAKKIVLPAAKELLGLGKKIKPRKPRKPRKYVEINFDKKCHQEIIL